MQLLKEYNSHVESECRITFDKWTQNYRIRTTKVLVSIYIQQMYDYIASCCSDMDNKWTAIWPNKACPVLFHINTLFFYNQWKYPFLGVNFNSWTQV